MPRIFDNIEKQLLPALQETIIVADRADFCVGYFNLRGWKQIDSFIERWPGGEGNCCRLLVGMQKLPQDELREALSIREGNGGLDQATVIRLKMKMAEEFRRQLTLGMPTNEDEAGLRRLAAQIKTKKVIIRLFLRHPLHAKLYLLFRPDPINPAVAYLGSSNLTLAGLAKQGELNVDVMDGDACQKLAKWFEERWNDRWCMDISEELVRIIQESWAREIPIPPYHIYIKMAYHLSKEAQEGILEYTLPKEFEKKLFEFQIAAVKIATQHLNKRGGLIIGDVVGLGKTLMATAVARMFDDYLTLIICPKNLVKMWQEYRDIYGLRAKVLSSSMVRGELPDLRRYKLIIIDESHNYRNREGKNFHAIQEYIKENECLCVLLSATPYNKTYLDLSSQLRLFVSEELDLGIRPERLLRDIGETEFLRRHQCPVHSLAAFEKSEYPDDWRDLMRLYLIRRTRSFIQANYAKTDETNGRKYLLFPDGRRSYFPDRVPKTVTFKIDEKDPEDQYARLYDSGVVDTVNGLSLPRYGLGNYIPASPNHPRTQEEDKQIANLSRAGARLMGFCRTNLFKRLESGGQAFLQSVERHVLRNCIYLYAIENSLPLPIGPQDVGALDSSVYDEDVEAEATSEIFGDGDDDGNGVGKEESKPLRTEEEFRHRAAEIYTDYSQIYRKRFKWLRSDLFTPSLAKNLLSDARSLIEILGKAGDWLPDKDRKLDTLCKLLTRKHRKEKVIIFTQFADTVRYLEKQLKKRGLTEFSGVTGDSPDPTALAWRFSPVSNEKRDTFSPEDELRVLVATDVLSEGQNLQDCAIVVNYDLPWAIIRLVQRVGRVDRIGQQAENILCYSFLPADGVEKIINLRGRVRQRLKENAEVVGTDEAFFEDDKNGQAIVDLYNEKAGILDGEEDAEVDLASYAYQIWKNAITADPSLEKIIANPERMPNVVYSTKPHQPRENEPEGVLVYVRTAQDNDALAWIDKDGNSITESQYTILKAAECLPETPSLPRHENHHELVRKGVELIAKEEKSVGGQLGRPSGARFRTYDRLKRYADEVRDTLFDVSELHRAIEDIYRCPLRQTAVDILNRQLKSGISDDQLAKLAMELRQDSRLCHDHKEIESQEPRIICSMGLKAEK